MDLSLGNMIIVAILALRFLIKLRFPANTPIYMNEITLTVKTIITKSVRWGMRRGGGSKITVKKIRSDFYMIHTIHVQSLKYSSR